MSDPSWKAVEGAGPYPPEDVLGERRDPVPDLSASPDPGLLLMFTVDTECSILRQPNPDPDRVVDELIFGDFGAGRPAAGIGLHMDLLEHFGFRGCFFVDVMMEHRYGQAALERTVEAILGRGHEIQLHLHTDQLLLARDPKVKALDKAIVSPGIDRFRRALELSVDLFERRVGERPIAYRAGGFRITDSHFPVLEELGLRIDSSICPDGARSQVAEWMRMRTQPYWIGGVLEVPPTQLLFTDRPDSWKLRGFVPRAVRGDPVSSLPADANGPPLVATYVSHSFQFLRRTETRDPEEIAAFTENVRAVLPSDLAERLRGCSPKQVRSFGEDADDSVVAAAAGVLRRIADRPDARCATYAELAGAIDRFWPAERHPSTDPVPLLNRGSGVGGATGARIYSDSLLSRLVAAQPKPPPGRGEDDGSRGWIEGLERCAPEAFGDRVGSVAEKIGQDDSLRLRLRTLGVAASGQRGTLPPLAELLFPESALRAVGGAVEGDTVAWDAPTFVAWLAKGGFEVVSEQRVARDPSELAECAPFAEKLRWFDPLELRTEAVEVELRSALAGVAADRTTASAPPFELIGDGSSRAATVPAGIDPVALPAAAAELYASTQPGHELRLTISGEPAPASRTTILLTMMRAGFEVLDREELGYRLIRPLELSDLKRFAGLDS